MYPPGYGEAAEHTRAFVLRWMAQHGDKSAEKLIHRPDVMHEYFRSFYDLSGNTRMPDELGEALEARDFERVAHAYRLIDTDTVRVLVPYVRGKYQELRKELEQGLPFREARRWFAQAAPLAVNIYRPRRDDDISALMPVVVGRRDRWD